MRLTAARLALLAGAIFLAVLWGQLTEVSAVDRCLDRGGSYDYGIGRCDLVRSQPVSVPREPPHVRSRSQLAAIIAATTLLAMFYWQDRRRRSRPGV